MAVHEAPLAILVADDCDISRELLRAMLEQRGHRVFEAQDGLEAVALVPRMRPDVVLMDLDMPNLDGLEAARRIRGMAGDERQVPIYAFTAKESNEDVERARACGVNGRLAKPVDLDELASVLRAVAARHDTAPDHPI